MDESFRVIARFRAKAGKEAELRALLMGLIEPTRREAGCYRYELLVNQEEPGELVFVEEWSDEDALEAHFATAHIRAAREKLPELVAEEMDLRSYDLVR
ncbi:MAG: putative quinol monooxygenase [Thermoanaerobaculia bacterium]